jgi:hypothetical protein
VTSITGLPRRDAAIYGSDGTSVAPPLHVPLNETVLQHHETLLKQDRRNLYPSAPEKEDGMRKFILGAILLAVVSVPVYNFISAARETKAATFSERFAPVLKSPTAS